MKYYLLYKITNLINEKIYIGCHETVNKDDGYMGSGLYLKNAQQKYGIENFQKEIISEFHDADSMFNMESIIVNEDFISRKDTYNITVGGHGGFQYINQNELNGTKKGVERRLDLLESDEEFAKFYKRQVSNGIKKKHIDDSQYAERIKIGLSNYYLNGGIGSFTGKTHTDETKNKIGSANSFHQKGSGNSQFGKMWITDENENKKIMKDDPIPDGWRKGRIMVGMVKRLSR